MFGLIASFTLSGEGVQPPSSVVRTGYRACTDELEALLVCRPVRLYDDDAVSLRGDAGERRVHGEPPAGGHDKLVLCRFVIAVPLG